ncbi:MAG: thiolase family protein [Deltaproteobacteria bacterium]|nr:thiolase family protein [Deltaproteobacteria bacterium]
MKIEKNENDIVVLSAARTPIGKFGGTLKDVKAFELGAIAIDAAIKKAGIDKDNISEVIYGNCRQAGNGPNPARSAALLAEIPEHIPSSTLNMACPSGMKSIMLSSDGIMAGSSQLNIAGGMDSMSTIPHLVKGLRFNTLKMGDLKIEDGWKDATDPIAQTTMGTSAELLADKFNISRETQDEFAALSHKRAVQAINEGLFKDEIAPIKLSPAFDHGWVELVNDETPRDNTSVEKLLSLKPVFKKEGSVTAGNSSAMSDGACALLISSRKNAANMNVLPFFKIVSYAQFAVNGKIMGEGPAYSIPLVLKKAGLTMKDIDLFEINEAFASQIIANTEVLKIDMDRLNIRGGAIALGHPTGVSGARIVTTLAYTLTHMKKEFGLAAICGAGGVTTSMIIKLEN